MMIKCILLWYLNRMVMIDLRNLKFSGSRMHCIIGGDVKIKVRLNGIVLHITLTI